MLWSGSLVGRSSDCRYWSTVVDRNCEWIRHSSISNTTIKFDLFLHVSSASPWPCETVSDMWVSLRAVWYEFKCANRGDSTQFCSSRDGEEMLWVASWCFRGSWPRMRDLARRFLSSRGHVSGSVTFMCFVRDLPPRAPVIAMRCRCNVKRDSKVSLAAAADFMTTYIDCKRTRWRDVYMFIAGIWCEFLWRLLFSTELLNEFVVIFRVHAVCT